MIIVETTTATRAEAEHIAKSLLNRRLAACVQVSGPITSSYEWKGEHQTSEEWRVSIKTRGDRFSVVEQAILEMHTYDQPEIIAVPVVAGNAGYLKWIDESVDGEPR
jgi:periplasmic divalent cation tolerance protein